jgi:hypothetical protein
MDTRNRDFLSRTAAVAAQLAFPGNIKAVRGVTPQTVWRARSDGGALATVAQMIHAVRASGGHKEQAVAIAQYVCDNVEAVFADEHRSFHELCVAEQAAEGEENLRTFEYLTNPSSTTASELYRASLAEQAVEQQRRAALIRNHTEAA